MGLGLRSRGKEQVLLVQKLPLNLERICLVGVFLNCKTPSNQDWGRESFPPPPPPPCSSYALLRDLVDLGGILLGEEGEGDVLGAMIGSLGLILSCEVENLRGRAILEVKSSLPFSF